VNNKKFSRKEFILMLPSIMIFPKILGVKPLIYNTNNKIKDLLKQSNPIKVVFTGDSVTQGALHTYGMRSYPEIFAERVRWEMNRIYDIIINSGINGTNSSDLLNAYELCIGQFNPDIVSIMFGINDCQAVGITPSVFENNLNRIVDKIINNHSIPILQTPNAIDNKGVVKMKTASREKLPEYVDVIIKVAKKKNVILVDNWTYWKTKGLDVFGKWLDDPLHPNAEGHLEIARLIFRTLSIYDARSFTCSGKH
jgi:lysophospholipase L1-like esterase